MFRSLTYPGNVRELKNLVERAILMCGDTIDASDLKRCVADATAIIPRQTADTATVSGSESALIRETLAACRGNITAAATRLGITRQALYRRIEKYGISI